MSYKEKQGDLIALAKRGDFDVIVHGCNCQNIMGAGIAKQIADKFPEAYHQDTLHHLSLGSINSLGTLSVSKIHLPKNLNPISIVNAYTQYKPGKNLDIAALILCLRKINLAYKGCDIGLPQIGCGIAGGKWKQVKDIIQRELVDCNVTVVIYKP